MKRYLLYVSLFFSLLQKNSAAQNNSFYLDTTSWHVNKALFTADAIYILRGPDCIKTDYTGNLIWAKSGFFLNGIQIRDQFIFGMYKDSVCCLDTAGNFRWMKKFNLPINPSSTLENKFGQLAFDGNKIFVQEIQGPDDFYQYPAVIVLDTLGNVLQVVCDSVTSTGLDMYPKFAFPSLIGGAWFGYMDDGFNYSSMLVRIDENGLFDSTARKISLGFHGETSILKMITTPDSNYIVITNSLWAGNYYQNYFTCTKFDEGGNVLWQNSYYDTTYSWSTVDYRANDATCDSLGNIYIVGTFWEWTPTTIPVENMIVKLDSSGNIAFVRGWRTDYPIHYQSEPHAVHFSQGILYCVSDSETVTGLHNTLVSQSNNQFTSNCFATDTTMHLDKMPVNINQGPLYTGNLSILNYTPTSDTLIPGQPFAETHSACIVLSNHENTFEKDLVVIPVPASNFVKIKSEIIFRRIRILNSFGQIISEENYASSRSESILDVSKLADGIYFLNTSDGILDRNVKFIVSH
jgi:hypothetical protein